MQLIARDAGDAFADEVARWVQAGLRIVPQPDPGLVVLVEPEPPQYPNRGRWPRWLRPRRAVTIAMRHR